MVRYPLTVFYDGACPLCSREMGLMKRLDRKQRLRLCDFSSPDFHDTAVGIPISELSAVIHARWNDGTIITGIDVFRAIWQIVGLGILARMSRLPLIDPLVVKAYAWFARHRLWLTGRQAVCMDQCRNGSTARNTPPAA